MEPLMAKFLLLGVKTGWTLAEIRGLSLEELEFYCTALMSRPGS